MNHSRTLSTLMPEADAKFFREFIYQLSLLPDKHLLQNDIVLSFREFLKNKQPESNPAGPSDFLESYLSKCQEMLLIDEYTILMHREKVGHYNIFRIHNAEDYVDPLTPEEFLDYREMVAGRPFTWPEKKLLIDFQPFYSLGPVIRDHRKIGSGQRYLNSYMAGKLQNEPDKWHSYLCEFLKIHTIHDEQILVDGEIIQGPRELFEALQKAISHLENLPGKKTSKEVKSFLGSLGFREGFGDTVGRILDNIQLLSNLFEEANPDYLEEFISFIPMISRVAIISPHGWFGQDHVLGRPDTGGQVVYILDQVRALEKYLKSSLLAAGLHVEPKIIVLTRLIPDNEGTTSNQRLEKIHGTQNCWILRVPFKDKDQNIVPQWISRFHVWPFLEQFALDGKNELVTEFGGKPDLIVGNYSDGNLVASLLSSWMQVIQCSVAHALEKSKYLFSDLYWEDMEESYHFSMQYTVDLISMNKTDIIISSTAQEISGTDTTVGQYESYRMFSMPGLYKVVNGINLSHPKFNVVSPGVDETLFFPFTKTSQRLVSQTEELENRLFHQAGEGIYGELEDPDKVPIFTMARLDKIKNLSGLVQAFGLDEELQERANLVVVTRSIRGDQVADEEELYQIKKMYRLIEEYNLYSKIRWVENTSRQNGAEMYRIVADKQGVFVQPALFEAFGLTVLESMASGLPIFATQFGGPLEIIQDGKNGFLINPSQPPLITPPILNFIRQCESDPSCWNSISNQGIARIREAYTWKLYSQKLLNLAKLYGFWNYSGQVDEKKEIDQYCNLLFHLIFKKRAEDMAGPHRADS